MNQRLIVIRTRPVFYAEEVVTLTGGLGPYALGKRVESSEPRTNTFTWYEVYLHGQRVGYVETDGDLFAPRPMTEDEQIVYNDWVDLLPDIVRVARQRYLWSSPDWLAEYLVYRTGEANGEILRGQPDRLRLPYRLGYRRPGELAVYVSRHGPVYRPDGIWGDQTVRRAFLHRNALHEAFVALVESDVPNPTYHLWIGLDQGYWAPWYPTRIEGAVKAAEVLYEHRVRFSHTAWKLERTGARRPDRPHTAGEMELERCRGRWLLDEPQRVAV